MPTLRPPPPPQIRPHTPLPPSTCSPHQQWRLHATKCACPCSTSRARPASSTYSQPRWASRPSPSP
ncbi:unnamed protein product [Chondrus crispus]|uniref:Uncharacterized protein n=1 Tax=Chondrus crispus TaxID=2769 RepID=R7Q6E9_CHOCR|nr:unnamed protein product [Chondrus crispus]CDF34117.1 unnamed protein product [Chondrus crispus]|eukprot:XP_005713936.1 unnamed protein product [Chondrus crispus]